MPESLADAAARGDLERMQLFLDRGALIDHKTQFNNTPLGTACNYGQPEAVKWLIAHGASVDPPGVSTPPIQHALGFANCEIAGLLLDAGLPIEHAAWGVPTAVMLGRLDLLLWLVGRGVDLDRSYPGLGVLRERALKGVKKDAAGEEIRRYLNREIDPPVPQSPPPAPRIRPEKPRAPVSDHPRLLEEAVEMVRKAGKKAASWDASGPSAPPIQQRLISFAAGTGIIEIVTALLDAGARPNTVPEGTPPPLTEAAGEAQVEIVTLLLERGGLPDGIDGKSWLPLASAVKSGDVDVVRVLLAAGANPRAKPAGGYKLTEYVRGPFAEEIRAMLASASAKKKPARSKSGPARN